MGFWFVNEDNPGRREQKSARKDERRMSSVVALVVFSVVVGLALICTGNLWPELSRFF